MDRLRRLIAPVLGAIVIPAVTLVSVSAVSASSPSQRDAGTSTRVAQKRPCTAFTGCAQSSAQVKSSALFSLPRSSKHSRCRGDHRVKPMTSSTAEVAYATSSGGL